MRGWWAGLVCLALAVVGCAGPPGDDGTTGPAGPTGASGDPGTNGTDGTNGSTGSTGEPGKNAYLVGPGLELELLDIQIQPNKRAKATFRITDDEGTPLDLYGKYTEGAVDVRTTLAWLDVKANGDPGFYTSYTTGANGKPAPDEGGKFAEIDFDNGVYSYELGTLIEVADPDKTHTFGIWATRTFEGVTYSREIVKSFLPSGGAVAQKRDVVRTEACNQCHAPLAAHGGKIRDALLCVTCHNDKLVDQVGTSAELSVMVHKIHRGRDLPSVVAGGTHELVEADGAVHDYSGVGFPGELQHCDTCHTGDQGQIWDTAPQKKICTSCHDLTSFDEPPIPAPFVAHAGGPQPDESKCTVCHPAAGGLQGIADVHLTALTDPDSPIYAVAIGGVESTGPGQNPEVVFTVTENGQPLDILATPMTRFVVTVAGPTTDYATFWQNTVQGAGATGTLTAEPGGGFRYVMSTPIPAGATGSYAVGIEAYNQPGGAAGPRFAAHNPVTFVAVTDPAPVPRREIVDEASCNKCHAQLEGHGGSRNNPQYCVFCHNANQTGDERIARVEGTSVEALSLSMAHFIHRIHTGKDLAQKPYVLGGFPAPTKANPQGTPIDFGEAGFPGDRKKCWTCHKGDSFRLPMPDGVLPTKTQTLTCTEDPAADADSYCDVRSVTKETPIYPEAAACTGCHDAKAVVAHTITTTTASGLEACATCHGPGADYDVQKVHQPAP